MEPLQFRAATAADVPFIVGAVRAAERVPSGDGECMYERVFGLERDECDRFLSETLLQESRDHQLTFRTFHVLTDKSAAVVACCSAWVEAESGQPSGIRVALAVSRFLGGKRWRERQDYCRTLAQSAPRRTRGALQLETFYVAPAFRGRGATKRLINEVIANALLGDAPPGISEISLFKENSAAAAAYAKAGFATAWIASDTEPLFYALTGSHGFLQMTRALS